MGLPYLGGVIIFGEGEGGGIIGTHYKDRPSSDSLFRVR